MLFLSFVVNVVAAVVACNIKQGPETLKQPKKKKNLLNRQSISTEKAQGIALSRRVQILIPLVFLFDTTPQ